MPIIVTTAIGARRRRNGRVSGVEMLIRLILFSIAAMLAGLPSISR